jgi:hypothetical protein
MQYLLLTLALAVSPLSAHADACATVRGYFAALDRQDFTSAIAMTNGTAQSSTSHMVEDLKKQAAKNHARVEVKVKRLDVSKPLQAEARGVPVPVAFHIDVVGHKFCFHKVARQLDGQARFFVDPAGSGRIVAIEGSLVQ